MNWTERAHRDTSTRILAAASINANEFQSIELKRWVIAVFTQLVDVVEDECGLNWRREKLNEMSMNRPCSIRTIVVAISLSVQWLFSSQYWSIDVRVSCHL